MKTTGTLLLSGRDLFPEAEALMKQGNRVRFTVSGNSMWPLIRHNRDSVLLERPARPLRVGDIVLLHVPKPRDRYVLHRIWRLGEGSCTTLGDGCLAPDPPVPLDWVIGRVSRVYRGRLEIPCDRLSARLFARLWLWALPVRRTLLRRLYRMARRRAARRRQRQARAG